MNYSSSVGQLINQSLSQFLLDSFLHVPRVRNFTLRCLTARWVAVKSCT